MLSEITALRYLRRPRLMASWPCNREDDQRLWLARLLATAVAILTIVIGGLWLDAGRWFSADRSGVEPGGGSAIP